MLGKSGARAPLFFFTRQLLPRARQILPGQRQKLPNSDNARQILPGSAFRAA